MADMGWFGNHGFYEAADFTSTRRRLWRGAPQLVRCWMAHHQGMSLLALANFLNDDVVQKWFHAERRVQATELLLHEKPVAHVRRRDLPRRLAAAWFEIWRRSHGSWEKLPRNSVRRSWPIAPVQIRPSPARIREQSSL